MTKFFATIILVAGALSFADAQQNEKMDRKVEIRQKKVNGVLEITLEIVENGATVLQKTYSSKEEMDNDPALQEYNLHTGSNVTDNHDIDVDIEVVIDVDSRHEDHHGFSFERSESDDVHLHSVWLNKVGDNPKVIEFESAEGKVYEIQHDEDGKIEIRLDGVVVDLENLEEWENVHLKMLEEGTMIISEDGDEAQKQMIIGDHEGDFSIELDKAMEWEGEPFEDEDGNIFFYGHEDNMLHEYQGVDVRSWTDEDGTTKVVIKRRHHIRIEISDVEELIELSEFPGSEIHESKLLTLENVRYYPNPSDGRFNLQFAGTKKPTEIRIVNMMGQEVYKETLQNFSGGYDNSIDLSGNDKGVYLLQIRQGEKTWNRKLAIN